eukprot:CAMPEP_0202409352 /NCGR_PEP_ID=MMETSP1128-20130828/16709_1 /ASSEMBLY_ACC=CAM_ASM_000463 /TAXON_ID=3047 /ORGANISM="Dunaliella tertiolecta, Strain CCMP1320" /LENGTH=31 /DNA_ID= /DNA_START= /DNA_END= /DNA_ORIENTATION=
MGPASGDAGMVRAIGPTGTSAGWKLTPSTVA